MEKIKVTTSTKKYKIMIGKDIFIEEINKFVDKHQPNGIYVVIDENVYNNYQEKLNLLNFEYKIFISTTGEKAKSFNNLQKLLKFLLENRANRKSLLINIGGGVIGDLSAFAASIYMRGISLIQVPTTLLSMVDSSIGGKTGINFKNVKNVIGTFYQPDRVIIDISFLNSLPKQQIYSGFGEIYKSSLISSKDFNKFVIDNYDKIINLQENYIVKAIFNSLLVKKEVVEKDEFEISGERKILNLGHTFGHAFESIEGFQIPHGICVIIGINFILYVAKILEQIDENVYKTQSLFTRKLLSEIGIGAIRKGSYLKYMLLDKKNNEQDIIKFVLFKNFYDIDLTFKIESKKLKKIINQYIVFFNK